MKTIQINSAINLTFSITKKRITKNPNPAKKSGFDYAYSENRSRTRESFDQLLEKVPRSSGTLVVSTMPRHSHLPKTISLISCDENLREKLRVKGINYLKEILFAHSIAKIQIQLAYAS